MHFNEKGDDVRSVQQALIAQGYPLPRYGADGHLGDETWDALQRYSVDHNIPWSPQVPQAVLDKLEHTDQPRPLLTVPPTNTTTQLYDLRVEQLNPPKMSRKFRLSSGRVVHHNPTMITGITIHQTAADFGVAQYQVDDAGGDRELALARRSLKVACHVMAFREGFVAWPNPLDWYVYHGNGFNRHELGIAIEGNYPGLIGGRTWDGKSATPVTDAIVEAACAGLELLVREGRAMGMPVQYIHAHRQSSATRQPDPGEELWKTVVLGYAVPVLGLITEPNLVLGKGRPIPLAWDDNGVGMY